MNCRKFSSWRLPVWEKVKDFSSLSNLFYFYWNYEARRTTDISHLGMRDRISTF